MCERLSVSLDGFSVDENPLPKLQQFPRVQFDPGTFGGGQSPVMAERRDVTLCDESRHKSCYSVETPFLHTPSVK